MSGFIFFFTFCILREFCQNLKTLIVSKQLKKKSWNLFSARLYQRTGAKPEVDREVHSRGLMAQRVTREVSILFIKFHECQAWFHFLWPYVGKNTENKFYEGEFWAEIPWTKKMIENRALFAFSRAKFLIFFRLTILVFTAVNLQKFERQKAISPGIFWRFFTFFPLTLIFYGLNSKNLIIAGVFFVFTPKKINSDFRYM